MEAARARQQQEREQAHARFLASQPRRTLRLCDFDSDWEMPTVREAVPTPARPRRARSRTMTAHLVVQIPEHLDPNGNLHAEAMKHIVRGRPRPRRRRPSRARRAREGRKQTKPLDERLPDKHAAAFGWDRMSDQVLIRPGQLDAARGEYDRRRADRTQTRTRQTPSRRARSRTTQARHDRPRDSPASTQIRARELAVDLAASGFDTSELRRRYGSRPHADTAAEPTSTQSREHAPRKHGAAADSSEPTRPRFASDDAQQTA